MDWFFNASGDATVVLQGCNAQGSGDALAFEYEQMTRPSRANLGRLLNLVEADHALDRKANPNLPGWTIPRFAVEERPIEAGVVGAAAAIAVGTAAICLTKGRALSGIMGASGKEAEQALEPATDALMRAGLPITARNRAVADGLAMVRSHEFDAQEGLIYASGEDALHGIDPKVLSFLRGGPPSIDEVRASLVKAAEMRSSNAVAETGPGTYRITNLPGGDITGELPPLKVISEMRPVNNLREQIYGRAKLDAKLGLKPDYRGLARVEEMQNGVNTRHFYSEVLPKLELATPEQYSTFVRGYVAKGGPISSVLDSQMPGNVFVAKGNIQLLPLNKANAVHIIAPEGVSVSDLGQGPGQSRIFNMKDFSQSSQTYGVPIFRDTRLVDNLVDNIKIQSLTREKIQSAGIVHKEDLDQWIAALPKRNQSRHYVTLPLQTIDYP